MNILVVGGGGREHAICWKLRQSPQVDKLYCAPGNGGIAQVAHCIDIKGDDVEGLVAFAEKNVDFCVVGPEVPLALGLVDAMEQANVPTFGPNKQCSRLEASKSFTKAFLKRHGIPTAKYKEYTDSEALRKDVGIFGYPMVIKADGLAGGKGVILAESKEEAEAAITVMMEEKAFGKAGDKVIVEECLKGVEASILCFVDEKTIIPMESAQDYKRIFSGDRGPNTGGMGTYSPSKRWNDDLSEKIETRILKPTLAGFQKDGLKFQGVLFIGIMITEEGPKVIEFNNRFGDPEAQSVLPRLENDLLAVFCAVRENTLSEIEFSWSEENSACVILASAGYPGSYKKGEEIQGLNDLDEDVLVFHSGTSWDDKEERWFTDGGRVVGVTARGKSHELAVEKAYEAVKKIYFKGMQYRGDIGKI